MARRSKNAQATPIAVDQGAPNGGDDHGWIAGEPRADVAGQESQRAAPDRTDQALDVSILPRRLRCGEDLPNVQPARCFTLFLSNSFNHRDSFKFFGTQPATLPRCPISANEA